MKRTLNTKIIVFTLCLILVTIAVSAVYITNSDDFENRDYIFLPLIVGLILTGLRTYNNISEKRKIVDAIAAEYEANADQSKMQFQTCPDYWTKETKGETVYCTNEFVDRDNETNLIGGKLAFADGNVDESMITDDGASNIGFAFAHGKSADDVHKFDDHEFTYLPSLRKAGNPETVEGFADPPDGHDEVPHKHTRTFVDYAHTDKPVEWKDGTDRAHDTSSYKDSDHLLIFNQDVYHDHSGNRNLYDSKGNLLWGIAGVSSTATEDNTPEVIENEFGNDANWISPTRKDDYIHAEINLSELNKKANKCHLVKNFSWSEAKRKCDNVNIKFDQ